MVGISTSYFSAQGFPIFQSVKKAYQMGFRLIELGANHDYEENIWQTLDIIKINFKDVIFTLHGYFPPIFKKPVFVNPAEGLTDDNKKSQDAIYKSAAILKAKVVSFHPGTKAKYSEISGFLKEFKGFKRFDLTGQIPQKTAGKNSELFFNRALALGEKYQIKTAIENIYNPVKEEQPVANSYQDFVKILKTYKNLYFLLDYGHAVLMDKNPDKFFDFGSKIIEVHLHDVNKDRIDHRILGTGMVNMGNFVRKYKELKNPPLVILEHSGEFNEDQVLKEKKSVEKFLQ